MINIFELAQKINEKWPSFIVTPYADEKEPCVFVNIGNDYTDLLIVFDQKEIKTSIHHGNDEIKDTFSQKKTYSYDGDLEEQVLKICETELNEYMEEERKSWAETIETLKKMGIRDVFSGSRDFEILERALKKD